MSWYRESKKEKMREYSNSEISHIIDEYIHNSLYRDILKSRYIDGMTYEAIAEKYDRTNRQIQNIIYKHEKIIFDKIS